MCRVSDGPTTGTSCCIAPRKTSDDRPPRSVMNSVVATVISLAEPGGPNEVGAVGASDLKDAYSEVGDCCAAAGAPMTASGQTRLLRHRSGTCVLPPNKLARRRSRQERAILIKDEHKRATSIQRHHRCDCRNRHSIARSNATQFPFVGQRWLVGPQSCCGRSGRVVRWKHALPISSAVPDRHGGLRRCRKRLPFTPA